MIYLDNAATSGHKPRCVLEHTVNALKNLSANPGRSGHTLSVMAAETVYNTRKTVKEFFNATSENNVCFTQNCTQAINTVLFGKLNAGDHIVVSSLEHNAVWRPANYLKRLYGVGLDTFKVNLFDNEKTFENFKKAVKENTKMVFVTGASNVLGRILPIKKIGDFCYEKGILFGVDAAQAAGALEIDMIKMHIDYLCVAPHKGFYAPMGVGILIAEKPIDKVLISGGTGVNSVDEFQPEELPERIESGTLNLPAIAGIKAGVDFVKNKGMNNIYSHELKLCQILYYELEKSGCILYTPYPEKYSYSPVISFNVSGKNSMEVGDYLNKNSIAVRSGLHCAPCAHKQINTLEIGTVRVSPSFFNCREDIFKLISIIKRLKYC